MIDCVDVGTAIVAYIEPHAGCERDFNRWYERDHFYAAAMGGPGAFAGGRFVATRDCKARRPATATAFGGPDRGSYLALYWLLPGTQPQWEAWTGEQVESLVEQGRMFAGRDHLHTAAYRFGAQWRAAGGPAVALALDRCYAGVAAFALAPGADVDRFADAIVGGRVPVAASFVQDRLIMSVLGDDALDGADSHTLLLAFVDGEVLTVWDAQVEPALASIDADVLFASPFLRTIPGTDTYVDQL
jgi:hypothetical protein